MAASGIDYAMIRIGYRTDINGTICEDEYASYNLISAQAAGIKTGVYFFSTAVNEAEAIEEAEWVVDYIAGYAITYRSYIIVRILQARQAECMVLLMRTEPIMLLHL